MVGTKKIYVFPNMGYATYYPDEAAHTNQRVEVIENLTRIDDVASSWLVRAEDGVEFRAFEDELHTIN